MAEKPPQPSWTPWAYVAVGVFGLLISGIALVSGGAGAIDAVIAGAGIAVIVVGVRKLRERR